MYRELYAVVDRVTEDFNGPVITTRNKAEAERLFLTLIANKESSIGLHPADHDLVYLGSVTLAGIQFGDNTRMNFISGAKPEIQIKGADWVAAQEAKKNG